MNGFAVIKLVIPVLTALQSFPKASDTTGTSDTSAVFTLGKIVVTGKKESETSLAATVSQSTIEEHDSRNVAEAINLLPGVTLSTVGARFETGVTIRGFDLRQVPLYIDGIPVYVPYDGYVDLGRFTTADVAEIRVEKGNSSLLYGPNAMGGAINIVSRKPTDRFELDAAVGTMGYKPVSTELSSFPVINGNRLSLHVGSKLSDKWYLMTEGSALLQDEFNLSRSYPASANQVGETRNQSYRRDAKASARIGYTPSEGSEYALSYAFQHGEKGNPVYTGNDASVRPRYWRWPYWDKQSVYLYSKTAIDSIGYIKMPLFFDQFRNSLYSYDDDTYQSFKKGYAFKSRYDDYTAGGGIEAGTSLLPRSDLRISAHYKRDFHSELNSNDTAKSADRAVFVDETRRYFIDHTFDCAVEDGTAFFNDKLSVTAGASFAFRNNERADDYYKYSTVTDATSGTTQFVPDSIAPFPESMARAWNLQAAATYYPAAHHHVNLSAARKTRFPTIKDRYSYKLGTAYPNPGLAPETATHLECGYEGSVTIGTASLSAQCNLFYSFIDDAIQSVTVDAIAPDSGTKTRMSNTGKARIGGSGNLPGIELAATYKLPTGKPLVGRLDISGSYFYAEKRNESDPSLLFTYLPAQKALLSLRWSPVERSYLLGSFEWNSRRWVDSNGDRALAGYRLVNMKGNVALGSRTALEAGVNNIFDVNYSLQDGYPEAGRNFYTNLCIGLRVQ
jgi:iron complex outermembrane recepter protein